MDVTKVDKIGISGGGDCEDKTVGKSLSKTSNRATGCLISDARQAFSQLRQAFTKTVILRDFDLECHIQIETDASSYAISGVLSQLILDNLAQ